MPVAAIRSSLRHGAARAGNGNLPVSKHVAAPPLAMPFSRDRTGLDEPPGFPPVPRIPGNVSIDT